MVFVWFEGRGKKVLLSFFFCHILKATFTLKLIKRSPFCVMVLWTNITFHIGNCSRFRCARHARESNATGAHTKKNTYDSNDGAEEAKNTEKQTVHCFFFRLLAIISSENDWIYFFWKCARIQTTAIMHQLIRHAYDIFEREYAFQFATNKRTQKKNRFSCIACLTVLRSSSVGSESFFVCEARARSVFQPHHIPWCIELKMK